MKNRVLAAALLVFFFVLLSLGILPPAASISVARAAPAAPAGTALQFNGSNQYVTFGAAPSLGVSSFTLEAWIRRTGIGTTVSTGNGGVTAVPLITKGRCENDGSSVDANYFLGINGSNMLAADFEDMNSGLNHPITGSATVPTDGTWHHVAVTYDQPTGAWNLFLDGNAGGTATVTGTAAVRTPRSDSIQHAALGTALDSTGSPTSACAPSGGFFQGVLDEARIWNYARSQSEIQADMYGELSSGTGLIARWGLNDGSGTIALNSIAGRPGGTLINSPTWVTGFPIPDATPPAAPSGPTATPYSSNVKLTWVANGEPDLAGYNLYRGTTPGGPYTKVNGALITTPTYTDGGLANGTPYYYVVRAVDSSANESGNSSEVSATPQESLGSAVQFDGVNDYVTFGNASGLGLQQFTVETWFKRTGAGVSVSTGSNGVVAVPLVTKGSPEADGSNVDENYILGIRASDSVLAADFETYAVCGSKPAGDNNPLAGITPISNNTWYHAAFTYDGTTMRLYLNGNLENSLVVGCQPRYDSIQHAGLGTYLTSTGASSGFFQGILDEARIWNYARTPAQIQATINSELTSGTDSGLVARWGMNEGTGTTTASTIGGFTGALTNGPLWVPGAPFNLAVDLTPPAAPTGLAATPATAAVNLTWNDNSESDLAGYNLYRSTSSPVSKGTPINGSLLTAPSFGDTSNLALTTYFYAVAAVDTHGNESGLSIEASAAPLFPPGGRALDLGSGTAYVTFGDPGKLDLAQFTIETWFKRTGQGAPNTTGSNGLTAAIPLVTHGAPQADGSNVDANWILAIDDATDAIAADFEDMASGSNHPVIGTTPIANGIWHHAAATYDGTTWRLYLDGALEATLAVNASPRSDTIQHAGIGTMLTSTGATAGHFQGILDEVRVWDRALSESEIDANINSALTSGTGLVARWALDESTGSSVPDSISPQVAGTIVNGGYAWVLGAPFDINRAPAAPSDAFPVNGAQVMSSSTALRVHVADPESDPLTVRFFGRPVTPGGPNFTIVFLPDTQNYTTLTGGAAAFNAQTQWVMDNRLAENIRFVSHLGDITENGDNNTSDSEWLIADTALSKLEDGTPTDPSDDVPFGLVVGNHDVAGGATRFENHFGVTRFAGRPYYGGHYGADNLNSYSLFSASGMNFIVLNLSCPAVAPSSGVLTWANGVLQANAGRRAIVVCHDLVGTGNPAPFTGHQGGAIFDALKGNTNLFLMIGGHVPGEGQREDTGTGGNTVYSLLADYQNYANGGNGFLRLLQFEPGNNRIQVRTYSPTLHQYETDANSEFVLPYSMSPDFQSLGSVTVSSGSDASINWTGLSGGVFQWYVEVDDSHKTTRGSTNLFTVNTPTTVEIGSFGGASAASSGVSFVLITLTGFLGIIGAGYVIRRRRP